jgi:hypothetical protein
MDPYLEQPAFWSSFHSRLIVAIADAIEPQLSSRYYVEVETRTYQSYESDESLLIGIPDAVLFSSKLPPHNSEPLQADEPPVATEPRPQAVSVPMPVAVTERYLEVREMATDEAIATIELLSPKNKQPGDGRIAYEKKRRAVLSSATHLVELDLLRRGESMPILGVGAATYYRILVSRSHQRPRADLFGIALQQPLPSFPIPLKPNDREPVVHLQEIFDGVYDRARYTSRIDYRQPVPPPALLETDRQWVEGLLAPFRGVPGDKG